MSTAATAATQQASSGFSNFGKEFGTAWIVSVYWATQTHSIANKVHVNPGGKVIPAGYNVYVLDEAPRDGYSILRVDDGAVHQSDFSGGDEKPPGRTHVAQTGVEIALGLVEKWTGHSVTGGGMIGIAVLPMSEILSFDDERRPIPRDSFLDNLRKAQEPRAAVWIDKAADLYRNGKSNGITEHMRDACRWLHGEASNRFEWMHAKNLEANKKCPACAREILRLAVACQHCQTNIPKFYLENGYTPEEVGLIDEAAADGMLRLMKKDPHTPATAAKVGRVEKPQAPPTVKGGEPTTEERF